MGRDARASELVQLECCLDPVPGGQAAEDLEVRIRVPVRTSHPAYLPASCCPTTIVLHACPRDNRRVRGWGADALRQAQAPAASRASSTVWITEQTK